MPWKNWTEQAERWRFVTAVRAATATIAECCRRFQISRKTGYKWLRRYRHGGEPALLAQSRRPACPQDQAVHERWHRTLQEDLAVQVGRTDQARLDRCLWLYNTDRAHEALDMRRPVEAYRRSRRRYRGIPPPRRYPRSWAKLRINGSGRAWWAQRQRLFGVAFAHQWLGLRPTQPGQWEVYLDHILVGLLVADDRAGMRHLQLRRPQSGEGFALPSTPPRHL